MRATAVFRFLLPATSRTGLSVANVHGVRKNRGGKLARFRLVPVEESRLNSTRDVTEIAFDEPRKADLHGHAFGRTHERLANSADVHRLFRGHGCSVGL